MIRDANRLDRDELVCELCIVGAGAAGITIATGFLGAGRSVVVLESGNLKYHAGTQRLYAGEGVAAVENGPSHPESDYLLASRLRYFGGSTNHWAGICRPLDEIDFEERSWIPDSGWPISRADLLPYYRAALRVCDLEPEVDDRILARTVEGAPLAGGGLATKSFFLSEPTRFAVKYGRDLAKAPNLRVVLDANVVDFRLQPDRRRLAAAKVATLRGKSFEVRAREFVLATGGIENARILLNADLRGMKGTANPRGLVGRHFIAHPFIRRVGLLVSRRSPGELRFYAERIDYKKRQVPSASCIVLGEQLQRKHRLPNHCFWLEEVSERPPSEADRAVAEALMALGGERVGSAATLTASVEQRARAESRVSLIGSRDRLGSNRVRLDWSIEEKEIAGVRRSAEVVGMEIARRGFGRLKILADAADPWPGFVRGVGHHLGTTRMHRDPVRGVVNENCRHHDVENLFVAGSSVFPTGGFANPTLTVVAMSLRLADHLKRVLGDGAA